MQADTPERAKGDEMSIITVDGQIGAGAPELGKRVARMFDYDYVDRLVLPRAVPDANDGAGRAHELI